MRKLYLRLYLAFVGIVLVGACAVGLAWRSFGGNEELFRQRLSKHIVSLFAHDLAEFDEATQARRLADLSSELSIEVELFDAQGKPSLSSHQSFWYQSPQLEEGFFHTGPTPGRMFHLDDGKWLAVYFPYQDMHRRFLVILGVFGLALAAGCYPLARQITRRLEQLQRSVEAFGAGTLDARAEIRGKDEIARLAKSFNATATQIQSLVARERRMLASASHELRSPLARLRMAIELIDGAEPARRGELLEDASRDIEELDALVEDLLTSVRAENRVTSKHPVELKSVVEAEASRYGLSVAGDETTISADRRMLHRLARNLIENARHHGRGAPVHIALEAGERTVQLLVEDEGPGVPEGERERIFEPFYRPQDHDEGAHGGVGLGLSLVRQIATYHGGRAWVEARDGGGSRFVVELARG